jgi:hypothetical protein
MLGFGLAVVVVVKGVKELKSSKVETVAVQHVLPNPISLTL